MDIRKNKNKQTMKTVNTILYSVGSAFGMFSDYFGVEPMVFILLALCFTFDFLTGMLAAKRKKEYESKKGRLMSLSKVLGIIAILLMALIFNVLGLPHKQFTFSTIMILAIHDLISSLRHIYFLRTNKELGEFDAISMLIKAMSDKLKSIAKIILKFEKDEESE